MADLQGKVIYGYTLQSPLGMGGMAEVWLAENKIGKKTAVKLLLSRFCEDQKVVERFLTEAKIMVALNHPNIRQVYDFDNIDGRPAIVMEYLEGDDLKERMKRGQHFTEEELVRWWNQLVDALNYTHKKGVIHRDIKPGNVFVDDEGNIKLLDFGIAKVKESISSTQTGQKIGTLMYMSPEQVRDSKHIDYHTDNYSLAVTFVHLLTGKKPYDNDTSSDFDIQLSIVNKPLDLSGVPTNWKGFLEPYLDKDASKRPELRHFEMVEQPVKAYNDDETMVDSGTPEPEHLSSAPSTTKTKTKSKKGLWIGLGVGIAAVIVVLIMMMGSNADKIYDEAKALYDAENYTEALPLMQQAADKGNARAQFYVGMMYNYGLGVKQDYGKALEWYQKSADQDDAYALVNIGYMYQNGEGVEQDYAQAMECYKKAADLGEDMAMSNIGSMYEYGIGVPQDYNEALRWYQKSADLGNARSQCQLGFMYYNGNGVDQDYVQAAKWIKAAAEQDNVLAQGMLGFFYECGYGVDINYVEAMKWYRKSADSDDELEKATIARSQANIGHLYDAGYGVVQDDAEAVKWYRMAADNGDEWAQYNMGVCYYHGSNGVNKDYKEALKWFRLAAEQGDAESQYQLGYMYYLGNGTDSDYDESRKWLQLSADQGNENAQWMLDNIF